MPNKDRIAITGSTGLLGRYLVRALQENGVDVVPLSRRATVVEGMQTTQTDYSAADLLVKLAGCTAVVHLAAERGSATELSFYYPSLDLDNRILGVCTSLSIRNVVYASSISVYSDPAKLPWRETQTVEPVSLYGIGKLAGEALGAFYTRKHGLHVKSLRFAHLYGALEENNYMINVFMRNAFNGKDLQLDTPAKAKREFLYAADAASAIRQALYKHELSGVFNIVGKDVLTNEEVAKAIIEGFASPSRLVLKHPDGIESIVDSYMDDTYSREALGFSANYNMPDAMAEIAMVMRGLERVPDFY